MTADRWGGWLEESSGISSGFKMMASCFQPPPSQIAPLCVVKHRQSVAHSQGSWRFHGDAQPVFQCDNIYLFFEHPVTCVWVLRKGGKLAM